jgi:predicted nucleic acid-binding protein
MEFLYLITRLQIYQEMSAMPDIIISDTSCLIILSNIGELEKIKKTDFRLSEEIIQQAFMEAGE